MLRWSGLWRPVVRRARADAAFLLAIWLPILTATTLLAAGTLYADVAESGGLRGAETGRTIMGLLRTVVQAEGVTAIVATHDPLMLDMADRVVELRDGTLVEHVRRG